MAATRSVTLDGLFGRAIEVEVDIASGLPKTIVVGLADTIVNEARDRVGAAVVNSGTTWPDQRVTINLAPARLSCSGYGIFAGIFRSPAHRSQGRLIF